MTRRLRPVRALIAGTLVLGLVPIARDASVAQAATVFDISTPGPNGPVTVIGDSVLNGAGLFSPTLPDQLAARGWGPIRFRAAGSATSGKFPVANEFRSSAWIDLWQSQGWDPAHVIVNLGVNDSGFCGSDFSCAHATIMHLVDAIGPGHQIWWPTITKPAVSSRDVFNAALRQVESERDDFHVWDWFAEFSAGGYRSGDQIHLDPASYRKRSARMAEVFTAELAPPQPPPPPPPPIVAERVGGDEALPEPVGRSSAFTPLDPRRIVDTRVDDPGRVGADSSLRVGFGDALAPDATAVALYVAAVGASLPGYLSAGPCGAPVGGATVNFVPGAASGSPTITATGEGGDVCIFTSREVDIVVDLQGVFNAESEDDTDGLRLSPLATPARLADTRGADAVVQLEVNVAGAVAADAGAAAVNLAVVNAPGNGFLSAFACDSGATTANVNFRAGPPTSSSAFVPLDDTGTFCVSASRPVDIVVDVTGLFSTSGDLTFVPAAPSRMLDTRNATGGWAPLHGAGQTIDIRVAPPDAAAATGTLTLVKPATPAYATGDACAGEPSTASVNAGPGMIAANSLTSAVSNGRLCVFASAAAHTVFDVNGWWVTPG